MKIKTITILSLILICLVLSSGCGWLQDLQDWKNGVDEEAAPPDQIIIEQPLQQLPTQERPAPSQGEQEQPPEQQPNLDPNDTREVVLYFASADGLALEGEIRAIPRQEGMARATLNQLIAGPQVAGLLPTIPNGTILRDINIRDGVCIVDFSWDIVAHHPGGLQNEQLTIYSIINTLSQFESIEQVRILIEGQEVNTLIGHIDISEAMAPYRGIIRFGYHR